MGYRGSLSTICGTLTWSATELAMATWWVRSSCLRLFRPTSLGACAGVLALRHHHDLLLAVLRAGTQVALTWMRQAPSGEDPLRRLWPISFDAKRRASFADAA